MNVKRTFLIFFLGFLVLFTTGAAEYRNGSLLLVLNEKNGRFSLYTDDENSPSKRLPLLADEDPRTSFLSVMINDRSYKLGDTSAFKIRLGADEQKPSLIFESSILLVTEEFSFIQTRSPLGNEGITITITVQNRQERSNNLGARYLLDTYLGEGSPGFPMLSNRQTIDSELLLTKANGDTYWTDRNKNVSLTGTIDTDVYIANWKRLSDASWKADYRPGRNFNYPPYSMGDTAVCYYFDSRPLAGEETWRFGFSLYVTVTGESGGTPSSGGTGVVAAATGPAAAPAVPSGAKTDQGAGPASSGPAAPASREQDLAALRELMARIDDHINSGTVTPEELASIESALNELRARYGP